MSSGGTPSDPVRFDDFHLEWRETGSTNCGACQCSCGDGYVSNAHSLTGTIVNATDKCASLDGTTFGLTRMGGCFWMGVHPLAPATNRCIVLFYDGNGVFSLTPDVCDGGAPDSCFAETTIGSGSCNPISLSFPGPDFSEDPIGCGQAANCGCPDLPECLPPPTNAGSYDIVIVET